jgi:hypothetical protein
VLNEQIPPNSGRRVELHFHDTIDAGVAGRGDFTYEGHASRVDNREVVVRVNDDKIRDEDASCLQPHVYGLVDQEPSG